MCDRKLCSCHKWCFSVFVFLVLCLGLDVACGMSLVRTKRHSLNQEVQSYLTQFGYMEQSRDGAFALRSEDYVRNSLKELQMFAGLNITGQLDEPTRKLLKTPRCGLPDKDIRQTSGRRKRFTLHGPKWPYTNLTWSLRSKQLDNLDPYEVRFVISKALEVWSKHSRLTFTEVESDRADILIYFYRREHGDHFPFDGRGIVLAHAFFPTGMATSVEVHFDADENWTTTGNSEDGTNMFNVAAHEIGHSLGLSHSNVEDALMYPWYKEMEDGFSYELPDDDKHAIQYLYGARDTTRNWDVIPKYPRIHTTITTTTTTTTTTAKPTERSHHTKAPKKPYDPRYPYGRNPYNNPYQPEKQPYYPNKPSHPFDKKPKNYPKQNPYSPERKYPYHKHTTEKNPKRSHPERERPTDRVSPVNPDKYPKRKPERSHPPRSNPTKEYPSRKPPPDTCDTSYDAVAVIRREVFIFKDAYFWRIGDDGLLPGYPAEIRRLWHGLPEDLIHIDAVYERSDAKIVFFVGKKFYVFVDNKVEWGYPKPLTELGLPSSLKKIDAAMIWGHNGHTYFYSGSKYWKFDEKLGKVELDYPRNISTWKGVGTNIDAVFQWKDGKTYFFKGKGFWKFNDDLMKVVHVEQRLSAPFWMGCSTIYENDLGEKLPYRDMVIPPSSSTEKIGGSFVSVSSMLVFFLSALRLNS